MMTGMRLAAGHFLVASLMVVGTFALCEGIQAVRQQYLPDLTGLLHPIFLPFGVMVLLTWVYGWLALPMMLPAATVGTEIMMGFSGVSITILVLLMAKMAAVPLSFAMFRRAGLDARGEGGAANWRVLVVIGLVAAMIGNVPRVLAGPCCDGFSAQERMSSYVTVTAADVAGMLLVLLAAMALFRVLRQV